MSPDPRPPDPGHPIPHRGKAPPVDSFTGENQEFRIDDWLPALERASTWNGWIEEEHLMQLAGHLRGRALQEWSLMSDGDKGSYADATQALRNRLDPGGSALAAHTGKLRTGTRVGKAKFMQCLE